VLDIADLSAARSTRKEELNTSLQRILLTTDITAANRVKSARPKSKSGKRSGAGGSSKDSNEMFPSSRGLVPKWPDAEKTRSLPIIRAAGPECRVEMRCRRPPLWPLCDQMLFTVKLSSLWTLSDGTAVARDVVLFHCGCFRGRMMNDSQIAWDMSCALLRTRDAHSSKRANLFPRRYVPMVRHWFSWVAAQCFHILRKHCIYLCVAASSY